MSRLTAAQKPYENQTSMVTQVPPFPIQHGNKLSFADECDAYALRQASANTRAAERVPAAMDDIFKIMADLEKAAKKKSQMEGDF